MWFYSSTAGVLRGKDDLPEELALEHLFVSRPDVLERQHRIDHRPDSPRAQPLGHGQQLMPRAHERAHDGGLPHIKVAQVDPYFRARRGAAGDEPAGLGQRAEALLPRGRPDVLDDYVHAASARRALDAVRDPLPSVI